MRVRQVSGPSRGQPNEHGEGSDSDVYIFKLKPHPYSIPVLLTPEHQ